MLDIKLSPFTQAYEKQTHTSPAHGKNIFDQHEHMEIFSLKCAEIWKSHKKRTENLKINVFGDKDGITSNLHNIY